MSENGKFPYGTTNLETLTFVPGSGFTGLMIRRYLLRGRNKSAGRMPVARLRCRTGSRAGAGADCRTSQMSRSSSRAKHPQRVENPARAPAHAIDSRQEPGRARHGASRLLTLDDLACLARIDAPEFFRRSADASLFPISPLVFCNLLHSRPATIGDILFAIDRRDMRGVSIEIRAPDPKLRLVRIDPLPQLFACGDSLQTGLALDAHEIDRKAVAVAAAAAPTVK
jgi:hypothetical protein